MEGIRVKQQLTHWLTHSQLNLWEHRFSFSICSLFYQHFLIHSLTASVYSMTHWLTQGITDSITQKKKQKTICDPKTFILPLKIQDKQRFPSSLCLFLFQLCRFPDLSSTDKQKKERKRKKEAAGRGVKRNDGWMDGREENRDTEQISLAPPVLHSSFQGSLGIDPSIKVIFGKTETGEKEKQSERKWIMQHNDWALQYCSQNQGALLSLNERDRFGPVPIGFSKTHTAQPGVCVCVREVVQQRFTRKKTENLNRVCQPAEDLGVPANCCCCCSLSWGQSSNPSQVFLTMT